MIEQQTSTIISLVRFPLAALVVYIHYFGNGMCDINNISLSSFSEYDLYNIIRVGLTYNICQVAVPTFFLISGYLFFQKLIPWNWKVWKDKIHRRIFTLLIPYLLWNIVRLAFNIATTGYYIYHHQGSEMAVHWMWEQVSPMIFWAQDGSLPIHRPFWFIRDLIVMTGLSPLFYILLKRFWVGVIVLSGLGFIYCGQLLPMLPDASIPGLSITALFFFNSGAFLSIHNLSITPPEKYSKLVYTAFLILIICGVATYSDSSIHQYIMPWVVLTGIPCVFCLANHLANKNFRIPSQWGESSFFIYAFHIFILYTLSIMFNQFDIKIEKIPWIRILQYLAIPFLTTLSCTYLYTFLCTHTPRLCYVFTGRRPHTHKSQYQ